MKRHLIITSVCLIHALTGLAPAADIYKANNTNFLNLTTSWTGGAVPGSGDVAVWDAPFASSTAISLGAGNSPSWSGIRVAAPTAIPSIRNTAGLSITLGSAGIDMSAATQNFTVGPNVTVGTAQTWTIGSGRVLTLSNGLAGTGVTVTKAGAGALVLNGSQCDANLKLDAGTVQTSSGAPVISGTLSGSGGGLLVNSSGSLTLASANIFSGGTTLQAGQLNLNHSDCLGSGALTISGGSLGNTSGGQVTLAGSPQNWNGDFSYMGTSDLDLGTTPVTLGGNRKVTVSSSKLIISTPLTTSFNLTKDGAGTLEFSASGSAISQLGVNGGSLRLAGGDLDCTGIVFSVGTASLDLDGGTLVTGPVSRVSGTGAFNFNGGHLKPRADSTAFMTGLSAAVVRSGGAIIDPDDYYITLAQPLLHDSALGATPDGGLTINDSFGLGAVTLTGACTYTGPTRVIAGTLLLGTGGSIASSPLIELAVDGNFDGGTTGVVLTAGQTLTGEGSLWGEITVASGATLDPGTAFATGALAGDADLILSGTATFRVDKGSGATNDSVVCHSVEYGGTLTVTATGPALVSGDSFKLFDAFTYTGSFTTLNLPVVPGLLWDTSQLAVDGTLTLTNTVPAPEFSPPPGNYVSAVTVTISSSPGSTIHYTTDGSNPTSSGTVISAPSPVTVIVPAETSAYTLKAYASYSGVISSGVVPAVYRTISTATWIVDADGDWSGTANWANGMPADGVGITADFSTLALTGERTVAVDLEFTVGILKFGDTGNAHGWQLAGEDTLVLEAAAMPVIQVNNQSATIATAMAGSQGMNKTGPGSLILTGSKSYSGGTTITGGILQLGDGITNGSVSGAIVNNAGLVYHNVLDQSNAGTLSGAGTLVKKGAGTLFIGGDQPLTGAVTVSGGTLITAGGNSANGAIGLSSSITITNATVSSAGDNALMGWGAKSLPITLNAGALLTGNSSTATNLQELIFAGGELGSGATTHPTYGSWNIQKNITVTGNSTISAKNAQFTTAASIITVNAGKTLTVSGFFENFAKSTVRPLTKEGAGTMVLGGANTYTGATTLSGGTLLLNGSLSASSAVTAAAGTTLGGNGTAAGAVTVNASAFLAPGDNGVGILTTGNLTLTGTYQCQIDGANTDKIAVTGALNLTGSTLSVSAIGAPVSGTYVIATATSGITGTFGGALPSGYSLDYGTPNQVKLVVVAATSGYASWVGGYGLTGDNALPDADPDLDGIANSIEFVLGGNPATVQDQNLLPTIALVSNPGGAVPPGNYLRFTYRRTPASAYLNPDMEFDADLAGTWTPATGAPGVVQVITPGFYTAPTAADKVEVYVPRAGNEVNGKLFGRLKVATP